MSLDSSVAAGLLLIVCLSVVLPFAPGLISHDTNASLFEAQTGAHADWYSPFGSTVWGWFTSLGLGLGTAFAVQTTFVVASLYALVRVAARSVAAAAVTAGICAFPPVYAQLSNFSRDTWFIGFVAAALAAFGHGRTASGRRRPLLLALAVVAAGIALLYRQNGVAIVCVVVGAVVHELLVRNEWRPRAPVLRRMPPIAMASIAAVGVSAVLALATTAAYAVLPVSQTHPERLTYVYDLAAITDFTDEGQFPAELARRPRGVTPLDMSEPTIDRLFDPSRVASLYPNGNWDTDFRNERLASEEAATLRRAWRSAILDHPVAYAWGRLRMAGSEIAIGHPLNDTFPGLSVHDNFGHPIEFPRAFSWAEEYLRQFVGKTAPVRLDRLWLYLLIATGCAAYVVRRSGTLGPLAVVIASTAWANLIVLGLIANGSSFRHMNFTVPLALVLVALAVRARSEVAVT